MLLYIHLYLSFYRKIWKEQLIHMPIHHRGHKRELVEKQPDIYNGRMNINGKQ